MDDSQVITKCLQLSRSACYDRFGISRRTWENVHTGNVYRTATDYTASFARGLLYRWPYLNYPSVFLPKSVCVLIARFTEQ